MVKLPKFIRPSEEWEIIGFCPKCKVSMQSFSLDYENGWEEGKICPKCGYIHEPIGGATETDGLGKLVKITIGYGQIVRKDN